MSSQNAENRLPMKERQWQMRHDAILDAATELLQQKGFSGMTLEDITDSIGISRPTLYLHFKSKEDLVANIAARSMRRGCETLQALDSEMPPLKRLRAFIHWCVTVRFVVMGGAISDLTLATLAQENRFPVFDCARRQLHDELQSLIVAAQGETSIRTDIDAVLLVEVLLGLMKNPALDSLIRSGQTTPAEIEETSWKLLQPAKST